MTTGFYAEIVCWNTVKEALGLSSWQQRGVVIDVAYGVRRVYCTHVSSHDVQVVACWHAYSLSKPLDMSLIDCNVVGIEHRLIQDSLYAYITQVASASCRAV